MSQVRGRVLIVHYTPPGVVGGVEHIIHQHQRLLRERGFAVRVVAGREGPDVQVLPQIDAARPESARIEDQLAEGIVSPDFARVQSEIFSQLLPLTQWADTVIAHNAFTLHFSLPLTAALWEIAGFRPPRSTVAWCHDLSWTNPLYLPAMHDGFPWDLLRRPAPNTAYVTVSKERKSELVQLWGGGEVAPIDVVPNGVDPAAFLRLPPGTCDLVDRYALFDRDLVLLLPVRITRRKNIEAGIRAVRALKDRGLDVCFLVTGPEAPHHPGRSRTYLDELKTLRRQLGVDDEVVFVAHETGRNLDTETVSGLYSAADVLLLPSAHEGFGLPILEAGLARLPIVLADIPIFAEVSHGDAWRIDPDGSGGEIADVVCRAADTAPSRLYRHVRREYRWDAILERKIIPLLTRRDG